MRRYIIALLLLLPVCLVAQVKKKKKSSDSAINVQLSENYPPTGLAATPVKHWNYKRSLLSCGVAFIGGASYGLNQTINHHYGQFKRVHPDAYDQFWNPDISWLNKYKDYNRYGNKPAFLGSTSFLVWATDAQHLSMSISNLSMVGATCLITIGERRKWWQYLIDFAGMSIARTAGFYLVYDVVYK